MDIPNKSEELPGPSETMDGSDEAEDLPDNDTDSYSFEDCEDMEEIILFICPKPKIFQVTISKDATILDLKKAIYLTLDIHPYMQKLLSKRVKGSLPNDRTIRSLGIRHCDNIRLIGSTNEQIMALRRQEATLIHGPQILEERTRSQLRLLDWSKPADVQPGYININMPIPNETITGLRNHCGERMTMTFYLEIRMILLRTEEGPMEVPMSALEAIRYFHIPGHMNYCILGIYQHLLEADPFYWVYWIPAQFVRAIIDAIQNKD